MFRSISWQLQFSYGLLVLLALLALGFFGFLHQQSKVYQEVDRDLQTRSKQISSMLVRHDLKGIGAAAHLESGVKALPPLPGTSKDSQPNPNRFYQVWKFESDNFEILFQNGTIPTDTHPPKHPRDIPQAGITSTLGAHRQLLTRAVRNYVILVGEDISDQQQGLSHFLLKMILGEALFFIIFLSMGYWLTQKALSPIKQISSTAQTIAEGNLSERIPPDAGSTELQDLSQVLNHSFDRLEDHLLRQQHFTAVASHELRTPITAILAAAQSKPETIEELRSTLDSCAGTARSMKQLVDQLLELTRLDNEVRQPLPRELVDLDILVDQCVQTARSAAEEKSITLTTELAMIQCQVNPVAITQIIHNLLSNAIAYTEPNGHVQIRLTETCDHYEIDIEDNGIGIAPDHLPHIFDRFFRANRSRSDFDSNHFGLGLAISQEIAKAHGGEIYVQSQIGQGSTFSLRLPK